MLNHRQLANSQNKKWLNSLTLLLKASFFKVLSFLAYFYMRSIQNFWLIMCIKINFCLSFNIFIWGAYKKFGLLYALNFNKKCLKYYVFYYKSFINSCDRSRSIRINTTLFCKCNKKNYVNGHLTAHILMTYTGQ